MKKKYTEKQFEKKILKRIYINDDKTFLESLFEKEGDLYVLKQPLERKDLKRLKRLLKEIRKSKSPVASFKIILVIIIAAAALAFNFFFKNSLVERGVTIALEEVFQAQADVEVSRFSLLRGELTFSEIAVADRDNPMKNLFELSTLYVSINMEQLLMKKAILPSIECLNITWNTDRETSGALESDRAPLSDTIQEQAETFVQDALEAINLPTESPEEIINAQLENLTAKALIEETSELYKEKKSYWEEQVDSVKTIGSDLSVEAQSLLNINPGSISSIEEARDIADRIDVMRKELASARNDIEGLKGAAEADIASLRSLPREIQDAIERDKEYLLNLVSLPEGGLEETLKSIAERYFRSKFGRFYGYLDKGRSIYARFSRFTEGRKGKGTISRLTGGVRKNNREVPFPSTGYPQFLLELLHISTGENPDVVEADEAYQELYVKNVSSNPALWDKPIELDISWLKAARGVDIQGELNPSNEGVIESGTVSSEFNGFPFDAGKLLKKLDIESYAGVVSGSIAFSLVSENSIAGSGSIQLGNAAVAMAGEGNLVTKRIVKILEENDLNLFITFSVEDEQPSLTVDSDIFAIIEAETRELLKDLVEELKDKIEEELRNYLAPYLEENELLAEGFSAIEEILGEESLTLNSTRKKLNQKKQELLNSVQDRLKEEVQDQAEDLVDSLLGESPIKIPSF